MYEIGLVTRSVPLISWKRGKLRLLFSKYYLSGSNVIIVQHKGELILHAHRRILQQAKMESVTYTYKELIRFIQSRKPIKPAHKETKLFLFRKVCSAFGIEGVINEGNQHIFDKISSFCNVLAKKWKEKQRTFDRLKPAWLATSAVFHRNPRSNSTPIKDRGRPPKDFCDSAPSTRRRKVKNNLTDKFSSTELLDAAKSVLRSEGKRTGAEMLDKIARDQDSSRGEKSNAASQMKIISNTPDEAVALIIDNSMTKRQYLKCRKNAKKCGANIFPSWKKVLAAKKKFYPSNCGSEKIRYDDVSTEINLQALADLTVERLVMAQSEVILAKYADVQELSLELIWKWGLDGSGNQAMYHQKFSGPQDCSDKSVLLICAVPLQLKVSEAVRASASSSSTTMSNSVETFIWVNSRAYSTRYCRPIKFSFQKEDPDPVKAETSHVERQITALAPTLTSVGPVNIRVKHTFFMTMLDVKTINALTDTTYTQSCFICGCTPQDANNLENARKMMPNEARYANGLCTLHAWTRSLDCCLHISQRLKLEPRVWQVRTAQQKEIVKEEKKRIQQDLKAELGIIVDLTKQGGGTTNTGNVARRFFEDPKKSAKITGLDETLLQRLGTILRTVALPFPVNHALFSTFVEETAQLYVELYSWYPMPHTVHKLLLHSPKILKHFPVPVGLLSEESFEARNKDFRNFRRNFSRKSSRTKTNEDILHRFLVSSDPVINGLRTPPQMKTRRITKEVLALLAEPPLVEESESEDENSSSSYSSDDGAF